VAPLAVDFTDTSTGSPTSWLWTFGDGDTSTAQNPSHTYTAPGTYTVTLSASNATGSDTATRTDVLTVQAQASNVLVGAGDIADCVLTEDSATGALVSATPGTVFTLGDNVYPNGTASDYANCYAPVWGAFKDRTRPVVGNHDYNTANAAPYYAYFGASAGDPTKGWYSYDIGTDWHVVVLNSNCTIVAGGCAAGSPQEQWLRADLAASTRPCTVAMWHHPRFSSGDHGNDPSTAAFWDALYADGAELVLNGHDHDYERFAPQDPSAVADPTYGIRELVVGTGGTVLRPFVSAVANSEVRSTAAHGVLKLTLTNDGYDWSFLPIAGDTLDDSGTGGCHGAPVPTAAPTSSFVATPTGGRAPLPVDFADTSTASPTSWAWDFGDGTTSTAQSPSHTYQEPGTYTVTLVAGNALGTGTTATRTITVSAPSAAGIARMSTATAVSTTASPSLSIPTPPGTQAGDVLVTCLAMNGSSLAASPAGWTQVAAPAGVSNPRVYGFYKVAGAAEPPSSEWSFRASVASSGGTARYSGAQGVDGSASTATGTSASTATVPGVTASVAGDMLVGCMGINSGSTAIGITGPSGLGEAWDIGGKRHEYGDGLLAQAGATGPRTWTFTSSREWSGWLVALKPS
jgi:PKD repeat protein